MQQHFCSLSAPDPKHCFCGQLEMPLPQLQAMSHHPPIGIPSPTGAAWPCCLLRGPCSLCLVRAFGQEKAGASCPASSAASSSSTLSQTRPPSLCQLLQPLDAQPCSAGPAFSTHWGKDADTILLPYGKIMLSFVCYLSVFLNAHLPHEGGKKKQIKSRWQNTTLWRDRKQNWCKRKITFRQNRSAMHEELRCFMTISLPNPDNIHVGGEKYLQCSQQTWESLWKGINTFTW